MFVSTVLYHMPNLPLRLGLSVPYPSAEMQMVFDYWAQNEVDTEYWFEVLTIK